MEIREAGALAEQRVKVRGFEDFVARETKIAIPLVVGNNDDHIGPGFWRFSAS
jgi:hypothetical protein